MCCKLMNIVRSTMVPALIITVLMCSAFAADSTLRLFREACPYTNFCSTDSLQPLPQSNNTTPCCLGCFCDEYCSLFNDCCPDIEHNKSKFNNKTLTCKDAWVSGTTKEVIKRSTLHSRYRFIDFCPSEYTESSKVKCEDEFDEDSDLDEAVLVSDNHGMIFKNKHCAICNGVRQIHSWNLKIQYCSENIGTNQLTLSNAMSFLLDSCILVSERPAGVPVTARTLECDDVDTCLNNNMDQNEVDACLNGPYMLYMDYSQRGLPHLVIHKNVFCYKCNGGKLGLGMCSALADFDGENRFTTSTYDVFLNLKIKETATVSASPRKCREFEILDPYTGGCRQLYCPPFEFVSFGQCIPLSRRIEQLYVKIRIIYIADTDIYMGSGSVSMMNESTTRKHVRQIYDKYRFPNCTIITIVVTISVHRSTLKFSRLVLEITYNVNSDCSIDYIGKYIRRSQSSRDKSSWLIDGRYYVLDGQITFYEYSFLYNHPNHFESIIIFESTASLRTDAIEVFFLCPYVKLSRGEYMNHVERSGEIDGEYKIRLLSPSSRYLNGFFPLSGNEVAACARDYLPTSSAVHKKQQRISIALGMLVYVFYITLCG